MEGNKRAYCEYDNKMDAISQGVLLYRLLQQTMPATKYCEQAQALMAIEQLNIRHIVDRSLTLDMGFPYEVLTPIPELPQHFTKTFDELCDQRAKAIITRAENE